MPHYFTDNADLKSNKITFKYNFEDIEFIFTTDNGVFSKENLDYGSYALIKSIKDLKLGSNILDLGCGWGSIGIILSKLISNINVDFVDINQRAIDLTNINLKANNIIACVFKSKDITKLGKCYDSIILNPPIRSGKTNIYNLYHNSYDCLNKNGKLYIVIQKKHGMQSHLIKLKEIFNTVTIINKVKPFFIIEAVK